MALINSQDNRKIDIPHEPGQWVLVRPPTVADIRQASAESASEMQIGLDLVMRLVVGWSYDEPVTPDAIDRLDLKTGQWLAQELAAQFIETNEKKDSGNGSSPGPRSLTGSGRRK